MFSASSWGLGEPALAGRKMYTTSCEVGEERIFVGLYGKVAITGMRNAATSKCRHAFTWACSCRQRHCRRRFHFCKSQSVTAGILRNCFKSITERVCWLLMLTGWLDVNSSSGGVWQDEGRMDVNINEKWQVAGNMCSSTTKSCNLQS